MTSSPSALQTASELLDQHDLFLIDAYGVLMTSEGPLGGATEFVSQILARGKDYFVVTNDASRTPESCAAAYRSRGINIPAEKVLSAGVAIIETFINEKLTGAHTAVIGTEDTVECVRRAGGVIARADSDFDILVIGDDSGFDFLPTMNAVLSSLHRAVLARRPVRLLLANPDLLYPRGPGSFGFTSGTLARMLEIGLRDLHPSFAMRFEVLGKPAPLLFQLAMKRAHASPERTVMLGDQLHTDIAGANRAGIKSALLATGITQLPLARDLPPEHRPSYILASL